MAQKDIYLQSEGDAFFRRNGHVHSDKTHPMARSIAALQIQPKRVLEIGCTSGIRLREMQEFFPGADYHGIDPSAEAVRRGHDPANRINLSVGTADRLDFPASSFDVVLFGFCLCWCDHADYFVIAAEANRVLQDGGLMITYDFLPSHPYANPYKHAAGLVTHKMDFSRMFRWHPAYRLMSRTYLENTLPLTFDSDNSLAIDILRKDLANAFPAR